MDDLKDDIDFLEQILVKIESINLNDQEEGQMMLRDQISYLRIKEGYKKELGRG